MTRRLLTAAAMALGAAGTACANEAPADYLDNVRWEHRLVIVCGADSGLFSDVFKIADWDGYAERDIELLSVSDNAVDIWRLRAAPSPDAPDVTLTDDANIQAISAKADCTPGKASVSLVGKDGGLKQRWTAAPDNAELFSIIDAMPMRMREMRGD